VDTISHAAWGYATLHDRSRLAWWGALAGAAPDLLFFVPSRVDAVIERGWSGLRIGSEPGIWRADGPPLPPLFLEAYERYYVSSHSLLVLALVLGAVWWLGWRRWLWLGLPYGLHIVMDLPTHERYLTRPLYPLSPWAFQGLSWTDPRIFWPNVVALVVVFAFIRHRRRSSAAVDRPRSP